MIVKLLTEHHLEFLSPKGGCRGSSESTLVKMSNFWKSHAAAHICFLNINQGPRAIFSFSWKYLFGVQWLSGKSARLVTEGPRVGASLTSLRCGP